MEIAEIVWLVPFVFVAILITSTIMIAVYGPRVPIEAVESQLAKDKLEPISVEVDKSKSTRDVWHVDFTARSASGETITGYATVAGSTHIMHYPPGFDPLGHLRSEPVQDVAQDESEPDLETRIRRETAHRLDQLQADREAFMAHDTNHDGKIDSEEWDQARARIEAEVRAELTAEVELVPNAEIDSQW